MNLHGCKKNTATVFKVVTKTGFWAVGTEWTERSSTSTPFTQQTWGVENVALESMVISKQALVLQALESISNTITSSEFPFISRLQHIIEPVWEAFTLGIT